MFNLNEFEFMAMARFPPYDAYKWKHYKMMVNGRAQSITSNNITTWWNLVTYKQANDDQS